MPQAPGTLLPLSAPSIRNPFACETSAITEVVTAAQYTAAKAALESDLADATIIQATDEVIVGSIQILESNPVRSADAIQIASALAWRADTFVSADARQCAAAKASGLTVVRL